MGTNKNIYGFSYMRAVACVGILLLHVVFVPVGLYGSGLSLGGTILYRSILNCLMWGVPLFLMVSGALLLDAEKEIGYDKLFGKYIARVLTALLLFGLIYTVLEFLAGDHAFDVREFLHGLYEIFSGESWSHLWYLYCLIGLYLLLPFFRMITARAERREIEYLLILGLVFLSLTPMLNIWGITSGFYIPISSIYPFYFFLGYYMRRWKPFSGPVCGGMAAGATILLVILTIVRWRAELPGMEQLFGYSSVLVILQSAGLFGLFMSLRLSGTNAVHRLLCTLDCHSFGIYLIHLIFVRAIYKKLHLDPFPFGGWPVMLVIALVVLVISFFIDVILKKLPVFRKIL